MSQRLERGEDSGPARWGVIVEGEDVIQREARHAIDRKGEDRSTADVRKPRAVWLPLAVVALALAVIGVTADREEPPESRRVGTLGAPSEPAPGETGTEPIAADGPARLPELAMGWRSMELPGWNPKLDVGESGWLMVVSGGPGIVALTSTNGLDWRPRTLPVSGWELAVHSGTTGMWVASLGPDPGNGTVTFRSVNGGGSWSAVPVPGDRPWVAGMEEAGGELYAFGRTGSDDPFGDGAPALWQLENGDWRPLLLEGDRGWVAAVVSWQGRTYALGSDDSRSAVWLLPGGRQLAVEALGQGFIAARVHDNRVWAISSVDLWTNGAVLVSDDLETWTSIVAKPGTRLEVVGGDLAVVQDATFTVLGESSVLVHSGQGADPDTGWRDIAYLTGLGSALNTTAMVGDSLLGGSRFYLRMSWPAGQADFGPRMVFDEADITWESASTWPASAIDWGPFGPFVEWEGSYYTVNQANLGLVKLTIGDIGPTIDWSDLAYLSEADGWIDFSVTDQGLYITTSAGLYRVEANGVDPVDLPVGGPARAATIDGRFMVVTSNNVLWARDGDGWVELRRVAGSVIGSIPGAFVVGTDTGWGVTTDGTHVEEEPGLRGWWVGSPFVLGEVSDGNTRVRLIDKWPEGFEIEIPTTADVVDVRWSGRRVVVRTPLELLISVDRGETWEIIPAGLENGVPRDAQLIPSSPPFLYGLLDGGDQALLIPARRE